MGRPKPRIARAAWVIVRESANLIAGATLLLVAVVGTVVVMSAQAAWYTLGDFLNGKLKPRQPPFSPITPDARASNFHVRPEDH